MGWKPHAIKRRWPDVNVIMLTISGSRLRAALEAGADGFVVKGGDPERLVSMLETVKVLDDR